MTKFFREDQVDRVLDQIGATRNDAFDASMIVSSALEHVQREATATLYPNLMARNLLPMAQGIDPGASHVIWHEYDSAGMARVIENYADDIQLADISVRENSSRVKGIGTGYSYSVEDIDALSFAMSNGRQATLDVTKPQLADEFIERKIDQLALIGDTTHNIPGFARNANVTTISAAAAAGGANAPEWTGVDKTAQEIFDDLVSLVTAMSNTSQGIHEATVIAMPVAQYNVIANTQFLTGTATPMTILEAFLRQQNAAEKQTRIVKWPHLQTAGTGNVPLVIAFDPRQTNMQLVVPREATPEPPQAKNFAFLVPVRAKCGGCIIKRPLSVLYMDDV